MDSVHSTKDSNFISAVVYVKNNEKEIGAFFSNLNSVLAQKFVNYEIIAVDDASYDDSEKQIKAFASEKNAPVTLVSMSIAGGRELCMNAGVDAAIGDFVFEFDTLNMTFDLALITSAYEVLLTGYDIVSVGPKKSRNIGSGLFYAVLKHSLNTKSTFNTEVFRVLSRRAINRVRAVTATPIYRKAAYATCGLKTHAIVHESVHYLSSRDTGMRVSLAVDSLALYTTFGYRVSFGISIAMLLSMLSVLIYTCAVFFGAQRPIEGWTTTMLALTIGFFGVFAILTIVLKYLTLLVNLLVKEQKYHVEKVEKL